MKVIILAAGKGKRLHSEQFHLPKVLRKACGRPLLSYVLDNVSFVPKKDTVIVVGFMGDEVIKEVNNSEYTFVEQKEQLGTGHAVMMAKDALKDYDGPVLVCFGDMPLFKQETYEKMFEVHKAEGNDCTILTGITDTKLAYGRIIRDADGKFVEVVEDKDCTPEQKEIKELNVGINIYDSKKLFAVLGQLKNNNAQGEYYLTEAPSLIMAQGGKVGTYTTMDGDEIIGVNTVEELEAAEAIIEKRKANA
jgi:UDP-N-acetylglucosamine diphosphorylase/glucosamine-1-phosphate N-acetyltransferase